MILLHLFLLFCSSMMQSDILTYHLESNSLTKGKKVIVKADIYYRFAEGKMLTHYTYPVDYIIISNRKGEAQLYDKETNKVSLKRGQLYSTDIDMMNLFLNQRYADLGLKDMGYRVISTKNEKGFVLTTWTPEKKSEDDAQKIEIAHNNYLPVYMSISNKNGQLVKKIFYSNYSVHGNYYLPSRVTEITYVVKGDSVIVKKDYSNFNTNPNTNDEYLNFTIPKNAVIIK